jgi:hypothetical protein
MDIGVRGSRFAVRGSRFAVRGSRFAVRGSRFVVRGSWLLVLGLTRPAGLALRATFGSLPSAISTTFRLSRSARLWFVRWWFWGIGVGGER